jgi:hypothetical protein
METLSEQSRASWLAIQMKSSAWISSQWRAKDFKYRCLCERKVGPGGTLEKDETGRKEAILIFSQKSYDSWEAEVADSMNYGMLHFDFEG